MQTGEPRRHSGDGARAPPRLERPDQDPARLRSRISRMRTVGYRECADPRRSSSTPRR